MCITVRLSFIVALSVSCHLTCGWPSPDLGDLFNGDWMKKLPSVEVTFGHTGVTVSTGPSREELYWLIGYIVGGVLAFILVAILVGFCIHRACSTRREARMSIPMSPGVGVGSYYGNNGFNLPLMNPAILSGQRHTHTVNQPNSGFVCVPPSNIISMESSPRSTQRDRTNYTNNTRTKYATSSKYHRAETPPPPYRSRN